MTKEEYEKQKKFLEDDMKETKHQLMAYELAKVHYLKCVLKSADNYDKEFSEFLDKKMRVMKKRHEYIKNLLIKLHEDYIKSLEKGEA